MFVSTPRFTKSANIFFCERFLIYMVILVDVLEKASFAVGLDILAIFMINRFNNILHTHLRLGTHYSINFTVSIHC